MKRIKVMAKNIKKNTVFSLSLVVLIGMLLIFSQANSFAEPKQTENKTEASRMSSGLYLGKTFPEDFKKDDNTEKGFFESLKNIITSADRVSNSNVGVKLYFMKSGSTKIPNTNEVTLRKENRQKLYFLDPTGKTIKAKVYFSPKEPNYVLALIDTGKKQLASDSVYTLVIKKGFKSSDGDILDKDNSVNFKTVNSDLNNKVYMILMVVMFVVMFGYMAIKKRRDERKAANPTREKEKPVNPYEIAKKTGKSVNQVLKELEKKKQKEEKRRAKLAAQQNDIDDDDEEEEVQEVITKKVLKPKGIKSVGYSYKNNSSNKK